MIYIIIFLFFVFPIFMYLFQKAAFNYPLTSLRKKYKNELKKILNKNTISKDEIKFLYAISNNEVYRNTLENFLANIACKNKVEIKKYYQRLRNHSINLHEIDDNSLTSRY